MPAKTVSASETNARVSRKDSLIIAKELRGKRADLARQLLVDLVSKSRSLKGKYYTNSSKKLLEVLDSAIANSIQKNMDIEKLFVKSIKADKGRVFMRPRSRTKRRGEQIKAANILVVLEQIILLKTPVLLMRGHTL